MSKVRLTNKRPTKIYHTNSFDNKGLEFIYLNFICMKMTSSFLLASLREDEVPSTVYTLCDTIAKKIFR